jgi:histidyl-tRNA synthetase
MVVRNIRINILLISCIFTPFITMIIHIGGIMANLPSIPKGTRDFLTVEMDRRNYIFDTIRSVFHLYGFQAIETPAMENLSTLLGKYGDEGDKLLFRILNSGDFLADAPSSILSEKDSGRISSLIAEKGLRYDLTVPFARFVVQHRNDLVFPFRRYQIQPVWRADRPQKGRYREFYQCDCDVIGSDSMLNEAELVRIADDIFSRLRIRVAIKINNRKVLSGIAEAIGQAGRITDITVAIDKMEKAGLENVKKEMEEKDIPVSAIEKLEPILMLRGSTEEKLASLREILIQSPVGLKGLEELNVLFSYIRSFGLEDKTELDLTLARGLNYYTGAIFEVKALDAPIGSICGGGRYDDLTGVFGMPGVSGVGISFGAERIFDIMYGLNLFPTENRISTKVLFLNFGPAEEAYVLPLLFTLRQTGIHCEIYPDSGKIKKQMSYAGKKGIPYVILAGETEMAQEKVTLRKMSTGEQLLVSFRELIKVVSE